MFTLQEIFQAVSLIGVALAGAWVILEWIGVTDEEDD